MQAKISPIAFGYKFVASGLFPSFRVPLQLSAVGCACFSIVLGRYIEYARARLAEYYRFAQSLVRCLLVEAVLACRGGGWLALMTLPVCGLQDEGAGAVSRGCPSQV